MIQALHRLQGALDKSYILLKKRKYKIPGRFQKVNLEIDSHRYTIRTVRTLSELQSVLRLRYQVFVKEGLDQKRPVQLDLDRYDFSCDHLVVIEKASNRIVGTYRLISSKFSKDFYSQGEFDLSSLLQEEGSKLELGRACIEREYRTGAIIALLWRGVRKYMELTNTKYMFGCASIKIKTVEEAALILRYLRENGQATDRYGIRPVGDFQTPGLAEHLSEEPLTEAERERAGQLLPPLMKAYFKAGALVEGLPAFDEDFQCFDFLTLIETDRIESAYNRRFSQ